MSSSLDPAQSTSYPQQQDSSSPSPNTTNTNGLPTAGIANSSAAADNRLQSHHQQHNQHQSIQDQSQPPCPPHSYQQHPQQPYYYPQADYSQTTRQQQQTLPRHPSIPYSQAQVQQQQPQQEHQSEQASASVSAMSGSIEGSASPRSESESNLRFKVTLDAQTAAMQHQGDTPVTYLNKGQFYTVSLQDTEEFDGDINSVIKVTFHEEAHRKMAARYWSFWLSQQTNPKTARALDIEKASSTGMMEVQSKTFDRISFKWNGKAGAKLMVRFNCLSTDFSRIKGVKGIPLRVHMDTMLDGGTFNGDEQDQAMERSYAKIKLFRDKGAERKNKDDHKHLEKMWDKMRGKNADTNPLSQVLAPVQIVSVFWECLDHQEDSAEDETLDLSETLAQESLDSDTAAGAEAGGGGEDGQHDPAGGLLTATAAAGTLDSPGTVDSLSSHNGESNALVPGSKKRRRGNNDTGSHTTGQINSHHSGALERAASYHHNGSGDGESGGDGGGSGAPSSDQLLDRDPTYVPQMRKKKQQSLCLYIKIEGEAVYRAVYLERLTLAELTQKLSEKLEIQSSTISGVYKKTTKKELMVRVDDSMVAQMTDELDMVVEYEFNQLDGSVNLTLKY
ncbi:hypothetical protein KVV02_003948 [Mortierella alpina]|uniref:Grh/CP2 DB domain-containing protein n=1 Tax=Mortierella alpina TaxID=64518 RepID=A0A9P8CWP3_MORAP|nr:hypothetical protein KVV02_003948 [Mortierella alpina]